MMGRWNHRDETTKETVRFIPAERRDIDLTVIREHLDIIEEALMHGYRLTRWHFGGDESLMVRGMDALLAVKKAFGAHSEYQPTHEVKSAILRCARIGEEERR